MGIKGFESFSHETVERLTSCVRMDLYDYSVRTFRGANASANGYVHVGGQIYLPPHINISDQSHECDRARIYIHEACHLIASRYGIDQDPTGLYHNKFFAVLAATCYRRLHALNEFRLYEMSDTHDVINGVPVTSGAQGISDDELIARFRFVVRASAHFANTNLSIEEVAQHLAATYFDANGCYRQPVQPKPKRGWFTWLVPAAGLAAIPLVAMATMRMASLSSLMH